MKEIEAAICDIQDILKFLCAKMAGRGHAGAKAELRISSAGALVIDLDTQGEKAFRVSYNDDRYSWEFLEAKTFTEALSKANAAIVAMDEHSSKRDSGANDPAPEGGGGKSEPVTSPVAATSSDDAGAL